MTKFAGATAITATIGTKIVSMVSLFIAMSMITYSAWVLYDSAYTNREAFISPDLAQYRPVAAEEEEPDFEEIKVINEDTCGWITLGGTHIDYPVVQGDDDLEYSRTDIYGKNSLTGSIYLTENNLNDFSNSINLIYGHHMDNGAMFGDIDKYEDADYFNSHKDGIITTTHGNYNLHVFARLSADAYDSRLYSINNVSAGEVEDYLKYVKTLAIQWDPDTDIEEIAEGVELYMSALEENVSENGEFVFSEMPASVIRNGKQLMAMSTCRDASTNGRQLLMATMTYRTEPLPEEITIEDPQTPLAAWGHSPSEHWALLNLICLIMTVIILLPGKAIIKKIRKTFCKEKDDDQEEIERPEGSEDEKSERRVPKMIGLAAQIVIAIGAFVLFIRTENMTKPMVIIDKWTLLMIVLYAVTWAIDVYVIKYARQKADDGDDDGEACCVENSALIGA